jgi:uncharacterized protein (DUF934 family)
MSTNARVLTRDGVWTADDWPVVREQDAAMTEGEAVLLPLAQYLAQSQSAAHGVWLSPTDDPATLVPHLEAVPLIAIDFPVFNDGRGYSTAAVLRSRYRYRGDLRAIGDVLIDQLFFLRRVGFSSFLLRADQDRDRAVSALRTFSNAYQGAADDPLPAFRRHARPSARELAGQDK